MSSPQEPQNTVVIDYTDIQPGDDAPDTDGLAAAKAALAAPAAQSAQHAPQRAAPHAAQAAAETQPTARPGSANVIVLSADPTLIELSRDALAGSHRVWRADDVTHAADLMVAAGNAVFLIDSSLADHNTRDLVNQAHQQFPDVAIIVAGRRDDEAELAPLVSEGTIFRFLHKPASAERIRNFVDATQRRGAARVDHHPATPRTAVAAAVTRSGITGTYPTIEAPKITVPKFQLDPAFVRRWSRRSLLLVPLVLVVWAVVAWKPWDRVQDLFDSSKRVPVAATDAGDDPRVLELLASADDAFALGNLIEPEGANALELYRAVLARDPENRMAQRGIDLVADELVAKAEHALMAKDVPALASAVDAVRSARRDHPRLAFFVEQLTGEQQAGALPTRAVNASVGRALDESAAETTAGRVQSLVQLANDRIRSNRLTGGKDSAQAYLLSARKLDPADAGVQEGIATLATQLQASAQRAIREGRLDEAGNLLQSAVALDVNRDEVAGLRADLEAARLTNVRADRAKLLVLANQRIAQGRLIEPAGDSARHYLDMLRAGDPNFEGLAETSALLASRALDEARTHTTAGDFERAETFLQVADGAGADDATLAAAASVIAASRAARAVPPPPEVLPEKALKRVKFSAPTYPQRALERGTEGWVDLEFTVATDGTVRDVTVRNAEPPKVFDRAAVDAVSRWRYEPHVINGAVVDQRVEARVRFELAE